MDSSSSDSDSSERVNNVKSLLIKSKLDNQQDTDESYAYKRKLGDLVFDANFEGGNLGYVEQIDEHTYDMMIRPDVANPRHRLWFNFTVSNQRLNQCVFFTFVNLSDNVGLFNEGLTPFVRCQHKPNWLRMHEDQVFYYKSLSHGGRFVLTLAFRFNTFDNKHQFALFYPYAYSNLKDFINMWTVEFKRRDKFKEQRRKSCSSSLHTSSGHLDCRYGSKSSSSPKPRNCKTKPTKDPQLERGDEDKNYEDACFEVKELMSSILSKSIYLLKIRGSTVSSGKPRVIITCRFGGNLDGMASLSCQGLIDFLLSDDLIARVSRERIDYFVFPMIDPDSICAGNSRTDIIGRASVNNKLVEANSKIYANLKSVHSSISRLCTDQDSRILLIELGANLNLIGSRVMGTYYDDCLRLERHLCFPRLLSKFAIDFYLENCRFTLPAIDKKKRLLFDFHQWPNVDQYKIEISPFAYYERSLVKNVYREYSPTSYLSLGKATVYSILELFRSKDRPYPCNVAAALDNFLPKTEDIDDLMLNHKFV